MVTVLWLLLLATAAACGGLVWHRLRKWQERQRIEEARAAEFLAQVTGAAGRGDAPPAPPPAAGTAAPAPAAPDGELALQKLLFDAARKAGEAGEPALAIQLYARLLSRFPSTGFAEPARAAAAALKKKLAKS